MRKDTTITAEPRSGRGKNEARRLRASGSAPGVLYGALETTVPVAVNPKEIGRILHSRTGHNTIFNLAVTGGENTPVMIVDWQSDPVKDTLLHVDLKRIDLSKRIRVKVPVVTTGEPKGVKLQGGLQELVTREIEIECLPDDIPEQFSVDVSELMLGQSVRAGELALGEAVALVSAADMVISHVVALKAEVVETPAAVEGAPAAAAAEPEVIKKGKKEEEGAAGAEEKKKPAAEEKKKAGGDEKKKK
jgi:large subunit ribosomal protein L25